MGKDGNPKYSELTPADLRKIVIAACCGTLIEWYDFFVFGSLSATVSGQFYSASTPTGSQIAWLAANAVGFIFRPFGSLVFGYIGDAIGRKFTFTLTLLLMGTCTFLCGVLPTSEQAGGSSGPGVVLIILRIIQGLAVGGEYGGAATYIAEHCPHAERGFWTSFLQLQATAGFVLSLIMITIFHAVCGADDFTRFGWRFPFIMSIFLVGFSLYLRMHMKESPMFAESKAKGRMKGKNILVESFTKPYNLYYVCLSLFGATMGQGCAFYTNQFYLLTFVQDKIPAKKEFNTGYLLLLIPALLAMPFYPLVGHLSDRFGRKPFMVAGLALTAILVYPMWMGITAYGPGNNYSPALIGFIAWLGIVFVAMCYGPIAAFMVELFPTPIRYTSMSFPYHIGNGIFGGLVPVLGKIAATNTGNPYGGLYFPIACCAVSAILCLFLVPETSGRDIELLSFNGEYDQPDSKDVAEVAPDNAFLAADGVSA
ncbi:major facilitator family transporter [Chytriomyces sp. MP71]|nr:major facilitator family transporter [Chytriomyces sp. MP71]